MIFFSDSCILTVVTVIVSHHVYVVEAMSWIRSWRKHRRLLGWITAQFVGVLWLDRGVTHGAVSPWQRRTSWGRFSRRGTTGKHCTPTRADRDGDQKHNVMFVYATHPITDAQKVKGVLVNNIHTVEAEPDHMCSWTSPESDRTKETLRNTQITSYSVYFI